MAKRHRQKLTEAVRAAAVESGETQIALSAELGISQSVLSRFLSGRGGLSLDRLDALAEHLGLRVVADHPAAKPGKAR